MNARTDGLSERLWPTERHCCTVCLAPAVFDRRLRMWVHADRGDAARCARQRRNGGRT